GLDLLVVLAAVGNDRHVREIRRVDCRIVEPPEHLLPPWRRLLLGAEGIRVHSRLGEAGAGRRSSPDSGMMCGEMPGGCAAHGETAHQDTVRVDRIVLTNVL